MDCLGYPGKDSITAVCPGKENYIYFILFLVFNIFLGDRPREKCQGLVRDEARTRMQSNGLFFINDKNKTKTNKIYPVGGNKTGSKTWEDQDT